MRSVNKWTIIGTVAGLVLLVVWAFKPKNINWDPSYSMYDSAPMGGRVFYDILQDLFPESPVESISYRDFPARFTDFRHTLVVVNKEFIPDQQQEDSLFSFAANGHIILVAATHFSKSFLLRINVTTKQKLTEHSQRLIWYDRQVHPIPDSPFPSPLSTGLTIGDGAHGLVLATDESMNPVIVWIPWKSGGFLLCTKPELFTNFYLLNGTLPAVSRVVSFLPDEFVTWDERFKSGKFAIQSGVDLFLNNDAIRAAYRTLLFVSLLFILTSYRRTQREIPVRLPPPNTTLQFLEVLVSLYRSTGSHSDMVKKRLTYFSHFIRNKYRMPADGTIEELEVLLAARTGADQKLCSYLLRVNQQADQKQKWSDRDFLTFNRHMDTFYHQLKK